MDNENLEQKNKELQSQVEQLKSKLDAIEKSNQQKTKFQLWLGRVGLGFLLGSGLKSSMRQLYSELPNKVQKDTVADVTTNVIWRLTRIGLFGILIALIPTVLLWRQNQLFEKQNLKIDDQTRLFEKQNEKIDAQIQLEESNRRGALIVMMSNIMDKVDEELKEREKQDSSRALSKQLIGRIAALSYSFRPYRFWQDSSLIEKPLSPERGQLLLALVNSDLDSMTYPNICIDATFAQANLRGANLIDANLSDANLSDADLFDADLFDANLSGVNLRGANLVYVNLSDANLRGADLLGADLGGAFLGGAFLGGANLNYADLSYADLNYADLIDANLVGADLLNANLFRADLSRANLRGANLRGANLIDANLIDANLDNTRVAEKEWLVKLEEWKVEGREQILEKYKIYTILPKDDFRNEYYLIKSKK